MGRIMALVKGNKLVQKKLKINNPKIPKEQDPVWPYLKSNWLSIYWRVGPFIKLILSFVLLISLCVYTFGISLFGISIDRGDFHTGYIIIWLLSPVVIYAGLKLAFIYYGRYAFWLLDGPKWMQMAQLLSPKNPSPGLKVIGTQLVTSRYLVTPGPNSSYNGWFRGHEIFFLFLSIGLMFFTGIGEDRVEILIFMERSLQLALSGLAVFLSICYMGYSATTGRKLFKPNRFFIFDRKNQTVSFHSTLLFRRMETYPWQEFEGRAVYGQYGYSTVLVHAPTGNILELQFMNAHWNNSGAVEAYSYVARFMDRSQSLPDEKEFERYLPEKEDISHLSEQQKINHLFLKDKLRKEKREKYHNPEANTVFSNIASFDMAVKEYPWLSAKNVWNAAHKYNREPNWDKWVRDKWGIAANEDYQVPKVDQVGEPEWFDAFYRFLKSNSGKIKYMDDESRIQFTQDWFEGTFPEQHWVDPVTADSYDQEEEFA
jgi:hypothetical protein